MGIEDIKKQIRAELLSDRLNGAGNKELIAKACARMFWSGITPNQSNVLEMVRVEGSAPSPPTVKKGLELFWETIRNRAHVPEIMIEGIPEELIGPVNQIAPIILDAAERLGRKWYAAQVAIAEQRAIEAEDAAKVNEQAAKDAQARVDTLSVDLAHSIEKSRQLAGDIVILEESNRQQAALLSQSQEKTRQDAALIERLESDLNTLRKELGVTKDARNQAVKELAATREMVAALRAQVDDAARALDKQAQAHASATDGINAAHAKELAAAASRLDKSETEKQALLIKNGELAGEVKRQSAEIGELKSELKTAQHDLVSERVERANTLADAGRVIEWIRAGDRTPAASAFTAGPERQIAYAVEDVLAKSVVKSG